LNAARHVDAEFKHSLDTEETCRQGIGPCPTVRRIESSVDLSKSVRWRSVQRRNFTHRPDESDDRSDTSTLAPVSLPCQGEKSWIAVNR
jgi:hypothetical protein